jgi:hypothetical protein
MIATLALGMKSILYKQPHDIRPIESFFLYTIKCLPNIITNVPPFHKFLSRKFFLKKVQI